MKKPWVLIGVLAAGLLLATFVVPILLPWSGINDRNEDINIKTGQARYSRILWFVKVSERIEDTPLSLALQGEMIDIADIKAWHRVNTFSPGVNHSPHYIYHGALGQAQDIERLRTVYGVSSAETRDIARQILIEWQTRGEFAAGMFLRKRMMELEESRTKGYPVPTEGSPSVVQ